MTNAVALPQDARIYRLAGASVAVALVGLIAPRLFASTGQGFAPAAGAAWVLLLLLALAFVLAVVALVIAVRNYSALSFSARLAGVLPALVFGLALVALLIFIGADI